MPPSLPQNLVDGPLVAPATWRSCARRVRANLGVMRRRCAGHGASGNGHKDGRWDESAVFFAPWENKWVNNPTACTSSKSRASSVLKCLLSNPLNDYSAHNSARLFTARSSILFQCLDRTPWACATFTFKISNSYTEA